MQCLDFGKNIQVDGTVFTFAVDDNNLLYANGGMCASIHYLPTRVNWRAEGVLIDPTLPSAVLQQHSYRINVL